MSIAVIKYNAGNIFSVECALQRIGANAVITDNKDIIMQADKVIFPGVGEASSAMQYLRENGLDTLIKNLTQPVLGICIGQQLLCSHSEEGNADCIGIFDAQVKRFIGNNDTDKIPHMGWNTISVKPNQFIPQSLDGKYVYYVHSYYVPVNEHTIATTDYIHPFSAALHKDNFYATQFHPEKSGDIGETILKSFLEL
ncbi:MAG: imidazole glycerol phosphate synthase subunit HisH [Muribaculaceae bacterium]|nr:imidazole glycerol phosphate synthase subunit HisH [Muribaculaceae bacterium]